MALPKWLAVLKHLGPIALAFIPGVNPVLIPIIISSIHEAEQIPGADGPTKKLIAKKLVRMGAEGIAAGSNGAVVISPDEAEAAADAAIDTAVHVTNIVHAVAPDA